jgi:hypothetical protein
MPSRIHTESKKRTGFGPHHALKSHELSKHSEGMSGVLKLGGVARRRFISRAGVVPKQNHPGCAIKGGFATF